MLSFLINSSFFYVVFLLFISKKKNIFIKKISLFFSMFSFNYCFFLWILFDESFGSYFFVEFFEWMPIFNLNFFFGIDSISLFFILLTHLLVVICILAAWTNVTKNNKEFYTCFFLTNCFLTIIFCSLDLIIFYIFFESVLIPMFIIIGFWGVKKRKIKAAYQFFLFTFFGSLFMLFGIFTIHLEFGSTDLQILNTIFFSFEKEIFLWFCFIISFAIKIPMLPFHMWLPEAHVEAPTGGSIILAGVLLKLGSYGLLRFCLSLFNYASIFLSPLIFVLSVLAIVYTSFTTLRQIDLKKIIAYSSIAHMGFVTIGLFAGNIYGIQGSILVMLSHGFISSALFLCIGFLYDRYHTRILKYYSGLVQIMPLFSFLFFFLSLGNLSFPGLSSFPGEFLIFLGIFYRNTTTAFFSSTGMIFGAAYSFWLCNRIIFGKIKKNLILKYHDLNKRELLNVFPFVFLIIFLGIQPDFLIEHFNICILNILQKL